MKLFLSELKKNGLDEKVEISAVAGFSLGEYSALTAAGVIEDIGEGCGYRGKERCPHEGGRP